ncbi:MAG TPA: G1 family glutamic endopeptidase, partial [Acidimicrobiales bacterium]|nr:G1 family glutamic endopeptidase [Acidimicrobiales bacterium]
PPAGASSLVAGLGKCSFVSICDLAALHDAFPNYRIVCPSEICGMVAAADWEYVATGVIPTPGSVAAAFRADGRRQELGSSLAPLWRYWSTAGLAGERLTSHAAVARAKSSVEWAIATGAAVIAVDSTTSPAHVGATLRPPGSANLIADGYTPKGPIVVLGHTMVQMTWGQWAAQIRSVWLPKVSPAPVSSSPTVTLAIDPPAIPDTGGFVTLRFAARGASACAVSSVPDLWTTATVAVPCVGSLRVAIGSSTTGENWTISFTADEGAGVTVTDPETFSQSAAPPRGQTPTPLWSGLYLPTASSTFTSVSGRFTVPTLNCSDTPLGVVSIWDGLGGENWSTGQDSGALLQTGVSSICLDGTQNNLAWWELWPSTVNTEVNFYNFPVVAGDAIQVGVFRRADGKWETLLTDLNTGLSAVMVTGGDWGIEPASGATPLAVQGSAAKVKYSGGTTAEWIVEDPLNTLSDNSETFANFGSVTFTDLATSPFALSMSPSDELAIVQSGSSLAATTSLTSDGFTTSYTGP